MIMEVYSIGDEVFLIKNEATNEYFTSRGYDNGWSTDPNDAIMESILDEIFDNLCDSALEALHRVGTDKLAIYSAHIGITSKITKIEDFNIAERMNEHIAGNLSDMYGFWFTPERFRHCLAFRTHDDAYVASLQIEGKQNKYYRTVIVEDINHVHKWMSEQGTNAQFCYINLDGMYTDDGMMKARDIYFNTAYAEEEAKIIWWNDEADLTLSDMDIFV